MITIAFQCGHRTQFDDDPPLAPVCPECGNGKIRHVAAPPPVFRGAASGPRAIGGKVRPLVVPVIKEDSHA